jgi:hypothetical protein
LIGACFEVVKSQSQSYICLIPLLQATRGREFLVTSVLTSVLDADGLRFFGMLLESRGCVTDGQSNTLKFVVGLLASLNLANRCITQKNLRMSFVLRPGPLDVVQRKKKL